MADDEDNAKTKYDKALEELAKLFCGIDEIKVHQYGFVLFYLPVYELLLEIKRKLEENGYKEKRKNVGIGNGIKIKFKNYDSDIKCCVGLIEEHDLLLVRNGNKVILHLGLSEPPSSLCDETSQHNNESMSQIKENKYKEIPFIRNFPLWGVALSNNPKIRKIESEQATSIITKSGIRYWDHFASNVTLLSKKTVDQFTYSVHSTTSTTFLEFKNRVAKDKDILAIEPDRENKNDKKEDLDEFTFIFRGQADIALTHQPWVGIKRGSSQVPHRDLEIVYTHVWGIRRKPASALYFLVEKENNFHKTLAYLFAKAVEHSVKEVSAAWTPEQMRNMATYYCRTVLHDLGKGNNSSLPHNCRNCEAIQKQTTPQPSLKETLGDDYIPDSSCVDQVKCQEETAVGYQVCIHNQIFFDPLLNYKGHDDGKSGDVAEGRILRELGGVTRGSDDSSNSYEALAKSLSKYEEFRKKIEQGRTLDLSKLLSDYYYNTPLERFVHSNESALPVNISNALIDDVIDKAGRINSVRGNLVELRTLLGAAKNIAYPGSIVNRKLRDKIINARGSYLTEYGEDDAHPERGSFSRVRSIGMPYKGENIEIDLAYESDDDNLCIPFRLESLVRDLLPWEQLMRVVVKKIALYLIPANGLDVENNYLPYRYQKLFIIVPNFSRINEDNFSSFLAAMKDKYFSSCDTPQKNIFDYYLVKKNKARGLVFQPLDTNWVMPEDDGWEDIFNALAKKLIKLKTGNYSHVFSVTGIRKEKKNDDFIEEWA